MCFGGSSQPKNQTVVNKTVNEIPAWMSAAGEDTYKTASPLSERNYPNYGDQRVADFNPDQTSAFDLVRDSQGSWQPAFERAFTGAGQGVAPIGQSDIDAYMNPYTDSVINSVTERMNRQFDKDTNARHGSWAKRGSYLNEDRRDVVDNAAQESKNRVMAETIATLQLGGFNKAMEQANEQKDRTLRGSTMDAQLAPIIQSLNLGDVASLADIGSSQQSQEQQNLTLRYDDFMKQFYYPQEQLNWLSAIISGVPYTTNQQTTSSGPVQQSNTFAQTLGGIGALAGGLGGMGLKFR